jgi:hypothetical protein
MYSVWTIQGFYPSKKLLLVQMLMLFLINLRKDEINKSSGNSSSLVARDHRDCQPNFLLMLKNPRLGNLESRIVGKCNHILTKLKFMYFSKKWLVNINIHLINGNKLLILFDQFNFFS